MKNTPIPFRVISNFEVVLCIVVGAVPLLVFRYLEHPGFGIAAGAMAAVMTSSLATSWPLRREWWFWIVFPLLAVIHAIALAFVDWTIADHWTGLAIMPFMAIDTLITISIVYAVYRIIYGAPVRLIIPDDSERDYHE